MPLINNLLHRTNGATVFLAIDLRSGYNNICIKSGDEWKTTFRSCYGLFEYLVMPFGLTNNPATFQHFMNNIFYDMADDFVVLYLDDILVFSKDVLKHEEHVQLVLERLRKHNLHVKPQKCVFHAKSVAYLGFIILPASITIDSPRCKPYILGRCLAT